VSFKKNNLDIPSNQLHDLDTLYLAEENKRRKEAILKTDTEKFFLFTRMMRISNTLKKFKVTHKKAD
jgi:hypothetical protein